MVKSDYGQQALALNSDPAAHVIMFLSMLTHDRFLA
jgi:hypothetical protein